MRLNILGDFDWQSRLDQVLDALTKTDYRAFFDGRDYGSGLAAITVVLMCQRPDLLLKRRIRFSKSEKKLYMDIMLDLPQLKIASDQERRDIVLLRLLSEIPEVLSKYKMDFDISSFMHDLEQQISGIHRPA